MLDVLFVHPNAASLIYQELAVDYSAKEPPIWAGLLANALRNCYDVNILDCEVDGLSIDQSCQAILNQPAKIIAVVVYGQQPSASTQNMTGASLLCKQLKKCCPDCKIVLIGLHPSALPEKTLTEEAVDYVCQGEGLITLQALLQGKELDKVPGLWYRKGKQIVGNLPAELIQNLEHTLPGLAWDLLPMSKYRTSSWHGFTNNMQRQPFASLYTSLGCPFKCSFCCINAPFGKATFRYWDPAFMIKEFDKIASLGIKNIKIADEMFVLNENHFINLCNIVGERQYDFNIWAYARIDTVKERYLQILRQAGVRWLALGIESGNKKVRTDVVKGRFEDFSIKEIVQMIKNNGIYVMGNFIFGLPEDNHDTMQETLDLAIELKCDSVNFYVAQAYPGSPLYQRALKEKWALPDTWLGFSQHSYETQPLPTNYLTAAEVLRFRDDAFHYYHTSAAVLNRTEQQFGQAARKRLMDMTSTRLKRKLYAD